MADPLIDGAMERVRANLLRETDPEIDPLFPTAILRGRRLLGDPLDETALLESWRYGSTRESGATRYRWAIVPRLAGPPPPWVPPEDEWMPWRPLDALALAEGAERRETFEAHLLTPLILADMIELLVEASRRGDEAASLAGSYLDEALPRLRRDAAAWVQVRHAWADTWALWALARRPEAVALLHPFALAIAEGYTASAGQAGGGLAGTRRPFEGVPLVSASAQLGTGLLALGLEPGIVGEIAAWIEAHRNPDGGWGDGDGPSDVLTTLVAADLMATLDPADDGAAAASWLARAQGPDGWWRAFGPESTWLSVEILDRLGRAGRPFAEQFRWPSVAVAARDRRTNLPLGGYVADLERLFAGIPALASAPVELAFVDLAGFGSFNDRYGVAMGNEALRSFGSALAALDGSLAVRDGSDEFLILGRPTGAGLPEQLAAFRAAWPAEFAARHPGVAVVGPRILTCTIVGSDLVHGRDVLCVRTGALAREGPGVEATGAQVDLGPIASGY